MCPEKGDSEGSRSRRKGQAKGVVQVDQLGTSARGNDARGTFGGLDPQQVLNGWIEYAKAEGYVRVAGHRRGDSDLDQIAIIEEEAEALAAYCRQYIPISASPAWEFVSTTAPTTEGHEHRVFMLPELGRVVKVTWPGQFGRWEHSPSQYLARWILTNELAPGLDARFHNFVGDKHGRCSFIMSMAFVPGRHPSPQEADAFLQKLGFERYNDGRSTTLDYHDPHAGLILRDCHPRNFIWLGPEELAPIDIVPELPL